MDMAKKLRRLGLVCGAVVVVKRELGLSISAARGDTRTHNGVRGGYANAITSQEKPNRHRCRNCFVLSSSYCRLHAFGCARLYDFGHNFRGAKFRAAPFAGPVPL